jgi:hypothetical protein
MRIRWENHVKNVPGCSSVLRSGLRGTLSREEAASQTGEADARVQALESMQE